MEIVLGVSMTPTTVRMAIVEGEKADGVIVEDDVFDISAINGSATSSASEQVIAAILGTQEGAMASGHHLVATGVSWSDHAAAATLREALRARGIDDVTLVSELHAAAALAQTVGRAVGYDRTALLFVEHDTATVAVVDTADGSIMRVTSRSLHHPDAISVLIEMATSLETEQPQGMFVVGSALDVASVKSQLQDLLSMPVIAPEEPQLALARGAALASAKWPRYDTSTIGLAYSQVPDALVALPEPGETTLVEVQQADRKPFTLTGSALTAVFCVGVAALTITMAVNIEPTVGQGEVTSQPATTLHPPNRVQPAVPHVVEPVVPARQLVTARLMKLPAPPPPRVVARVAAPAPAAPPAPPAAPPPAAPPPAAPPLVPIFQLPLPGLPPIVVGPRYDPPGPRVPWFPAPHSGGSHGGHGGRHGGHGGD